MLSPYQKIDSKRLARFLAKITYCEENFKFVKVNYKSNITQRMQWIVYWDVPSFKKLLKKKKQLLLQVDPNSLKDRFLP